MEQKTVNKQYLKYKDKLKTQRIVKIVSQGVMLLTVILAFFLPIFRVVDREAESLFGINPLGLRTRVDFSIFDELKNAIILFGTRATDFFFIAIYELIDGVYLVIVAGYLIFDIVKNILGCVNSENYALLEYDKIKKNSSSRRVRYRGSANLFIGAVVFTILELFFVRMLFDGEPNIQVSAPLKMMYVNGLGWGFWIMPIFLIGSAVLFVIEKILSRRIKIDILREDYSAGENKLSYEAENVFEELGEAPQPHHSNTASEPAEKEPTGTDETV